MGQDKHIKELSDKELIRLGKSLQQVYDTGYLSLSRMLWLTFLKGCMYGLGIFLGGTLVVGLVAWVLGFFDQVPLLQPIIDAILKAIQVSGAS
jgi:hypothetical protein